MAITVFRVLLCTRTQGAIRLHYYDLTTKLRSKFYPHFIDGDSGVQINQLAEDYKEVSSGASNTW